MEYIQSDKSKKLSNTRGQLQMNGQATSSFTAPPEDDLDNVRKRANIQKRINKAAMADYSLSYLRNCYNDENVSIVYDEVNDSINVYKVNDDLSREFDFKIDKDNVIFDNLNNVSYQTNRIVSATQLQSEQNERNNTTSSFNDSEFSGNINKGGTLDEFTVISKRKVKKTVEEINVNLNETASSLIRLTGAGTLGVDLYKLIEAVGPKGLLSMQQDIIENIMKTLVERAGKLAGKYAKQISQLALTAPTEIEKYTKLRFNWTKEDAVAAGEPNAEIKKSLGDILAELNLELEETQAQTQEISKQTKMKKFIDNVTQKAPKTINTVNTFINKSSKEVEDILGHAMEGPTYLSQQLNDFSNKKLEWCDNQLSQEYKSIKKTVDKFCKNTGEEIGTNLVEQYNEHITNEAEKLIHNQNKSIVKSKTKAAQAIQVAKLQIMAKTNIELPI